jgi:hypothetical protein
MTMFPANMPEMPPEMMGPVMDDPQGFADAMGSGMEAFSAAMEGGGSMEAAFEAFGDVAGPMMMDMGIPQDVFDAVGDMVGAAVGPAMMMAPADCGGGDMGAMMTDAVDMMMPEGIDMPPEVGGAMMDMGTAMGDAGVMPHDVAGEMMAPPGEPGYPMPCDAAGDPVMVPGDPASVPAEVVQAPPADGAMADMGTMMPPEGGYDHPAMDGNMTMPEPMTFDLAIAPALGEEGFVGADPMADAMGGAPVIGDEGFVEAAPVDAMDAAVGSAMDGAMDQGGPAGGDMAKPDPDGSLALDAETAALAAENDAADPTAGMG